MDAAKQLDSFILRPGVYEQSCKTITIPRSVPFQAFLLRDYAGSFFTNKQFEEIKASRRLLVPVIQARLTGIDLFRKATPPPKTAQADGAEFGYDPQSLNPLLLQIILLLDAHETMPGLLDIEGRLADAITRASRDSAAPVPVVSGWWMYPEGYSYGILTHSGTSERSMELFLARVAQRDLLVLMAHMMRKRAYTPYLATRFEAAYAKEMRARVKKDDLTRYKPDAPDSKPSYVTIDPILHVPMLAFKPVLIPYSPEIRDEIRAAATQWGSEHP
ncbi:MAG: hypothetical protein QM755_03435 [Luteolibacter sp.]